MSQEDGTTPEEETPAKDEPLVMSEEFTRPITVEEQDRNEQYQADRVKYLLERDQQLANAFGTGMPGLTIQHTDTVSYDSPLIRRVVMAVLLVHQPEDPFAKIRVKKQVIDVAAYFPLIAKLVQNIVEAITTSRASMPYAGAPADAAAPKPPKE